MRDDHIYQGASSLNDEQPVYTTFYVIIYYMYIFLVSGYLKSVVVTCFNR